MEEEDLNVKIGNKSVKNIDRFKYKGITFTKAGKMEITEEMVKYIKNVGALYSILKDHFRTTGSSVFGSIHLHYVEQRAGQPFPKTDAECSWLR